MLYKSKTGWLWFFSASFVLKFVKDRLTFVNNPIKNSKQKFWKLFLALVVNFKVRTFACEMETYTKLDLDNSWNKCYIVEPKNDVSLLHLWIQCVLSLPSTEREKTLNIIAKMRQFYLYYVIDLCAFYELHSTLQECQKSLAVETCGKH